MKQNKILKILLQIVFFIWIPESFSITLFALKTLVSSVVLLRFEHILDPIIILTGTVVSTALFGRYYCGYICAFGAMQDLSFDVRGLLSKEKKKYIVPTKADVFLSKIKYIILAVILILAIGGKGIPAELSPWTCFGNICSFVSGSTDIHRVLTAGLCILLAIVVITAFYFRAFCRYLCPVGALYSLVSGFSHDRRRKTCRNSGDCCICPYKCGKYRIYTPGLILAILIFTGTNLYLAYGYDRWTENTAKSVLTESVPAESASAESASAESVPAEGASAESVPAEGASAESVPAESASAESVPAESVSVERFSAENASAETEIPAEEEPVITVEETTKEVEETPEAGPFPNGIHEGSGSGYKGEIAVSVVVENGYIVSVEVTKNKDDASYFRSVEHKLIEEILETQSLDVDVVSGATYSSNGLIEAIQKALDSYDEPEDDTAEESETPTEAEERTEEEAGSIFLDLSHLEDGVYEGTGIGFRGEIEVAVTVRDHKAESIRILSYYDNEEYLFHVSQPVIDEVISGEPLDIDAVSGATYSSNGLTRAIADALQVDENTFVILEARPRKMKNKESHHVTQKIIESDEQYQELVEKYTELMYGADGKKKTD